MTNSQVPSSQLPLQRATNVGKAIRNSTRLRLLAMLSEGELCVCQLTALVGLAPSTVSEHLAELRKSDLVTEQKRGRWVHYRLVRNGELWALVRQLLELITRDPEIEHDAVKVAALREVPLDAVCQPGFDIGTVTGPPCVRAKPARHSHSQR